MAVAAGGQECRHCAPDQNEGAEREGCLVAGVVEQQAAKGSAPASAEYRGHERSESDSLIVRATLDSGEVGYGEGVPRPYVTGETIYVDGGRLALNYTV